MPEDSVITNGFWLGKSAGFSIRPYRNADRAEIRHICCETGFLGNPIDPIFCDRKLVADLMANPYLDYAEDWAYVATHNSRVVGYLLGVPPCFDRYLVYAGSAATLHMLLKSVSGAYAHHPRSSQFVEWLPTRSFRERPRHGAVRQGREKPGDVHPAGPRNGAMHGGAPLLSAKPQIARNAEKGAVRGSHFRPGDADREPDSDW